MKIIKYLIVLGVMSVASAQQTMHLEQVNNNLCDKASLQRGAQLYMNYCSGCHSLQFIRLKEMAKDIGIVDKEGNVLEKLVLENFNFFNDNIHQSLQNALPKKEAEQWFGVAPPDLSLVTRARGKNWVYTYLMTFYQDPNRPWGVNNRIFPDVGMPHVLQSLQGSQVPIFTTAHLIDDEGNPYDKQVIDSLKLEKPGSLTEDQFTQVVTDLVNFLEYVSEPHKLERQRLGVWVLLFLSLFALLAYLLKREYWKDIN